MTTRRGQLQSLLLAIILATGAALAWIAAIGIFLAIVTAIFPDCPEVRERLDVSADGTPYIDSHQDKGDGYPFRTLEGKSLKILATTNDPTLRVQNKQASHLLWRWTRLHSLGKTTTIWYFVHDGSIQGHGYFVGYDDETKLPIEYIGRKGFRSEKPAEEEQFAVDMHKISQRRAFWSDWCFEWDAGGNARSGRWLFLLSDDGLVAIDFDGRTAKLIWKAPDLVSTALTDRDPLAAMKHLRHETTRSTLLLLVRTPDRVLGLDFDGREIERYVIPPELRDDLLLWHRLSDGRVLIRRDTYLLDNKLFWINAAGKIVRYEKVNLSVIREARRPWPNWLVHHAADMFTMPSPAVIFGLLASNPWETFHDSQQKRSPGYFAAMRQALGDKWLLFTVNGMVGVVLAIFCFRRQRKFGLPWTGVWTAFVLLFGLPGYFGYLAHRAWPVRLPCPKCGRRVPRDRTACFACGRDFPTPTPKGIEVFA
jgi:hypothetical protein